MVFGEMGWMDGWVGAWAGKSVRQCWMTWARFSCFATIHRAVGIVIRGGYGGGLPLILILILIMLMISGSNYPLMVTEVVGHWPARLTSDEGTSSPARHYRDYDCHWGQMRQKVPCEEPVAMTQDR